VAELPMEVENGASEWRAPRGVPEIDARAMVEQKLNELCAALRTRQVECWGAGRDCPGGVSGRRRGKVVHVKTAL
jgi:hypothetical protein